MRRVSEPVTRPFCPACVKLMTLSRIDFDTLGTEERTYRCLSCGKTEKIETKAKGPGTAA